MGVRELELLIVVKAYPNPSESQGEACCVIGTHKELGFVRLYPIPFRDLEDSKKFEKYEVVKLQVRDPKSDSRPNTFRPQLDTMEIVRLPLPTEDAWQSRKDWLLPFVDDSMCRIQTQQAEHGTSIGFFKPAEVTNLTQHLEEPPVWTPAQLAKLQQDDLFMDKNKKLLEKIPYKWKYHYKCSDPNCKGHKQTIVDWEIDAFYLRHIKSKGIIDPDTIHKMIKDKFLHELCGPKKDTYFFTGNMRSHPRDFLVLGVFWPPVDLQGRLL